MKYKIVAIGEVLWDMLPHGRQVGGAPGNFAFHCSQLGAETSIISAVGKDFLGRELLQYYEEIGLNTDLIEVVADSPTGTVGVDFQKGEPVYSIQENVAWDRITARRTHVERIAEADVLYYGSLVTRTAGVREAVCTLIDTAPKHVLRVLDINLRAPFYSREMLLPLLERTNILKLSGEEIALLSEMLHGPKTRPERQAEWLCRTFDYRLIALTLGERGAILFSPDGCSHYSSPAVQVVDTVGAGDSFTAQTVIGWLSHFSLEKINRLANELAAFVCTRSGGTPKHETRSSRAHQRCEPVETRVG